MRWHWVVVAGLAAGVLVNLSGMGLVYLVLGRPHIEALVAHLPGPPGPGTAVRHLGIRFAFGMLAVLLYASLRPSYASGLAAACASGAFLFLAAYVPLSLALNEFGILTGWRLGVTLAWGLGEAVLASFVGALVWQAELFRTLRTAALAAGCLAIACGAPDVPPAPEFRREVTFADHREIEVRLPAGDVALAGTLYLPLGSGPFPSVVYVHGSGRETRMPFIDAQTGRLTYSAKPWVDHGIAVFSYDKRGAGASGGTCCPFREAGYFPLLAGDALAAVVALGHHAAVDRSRIGLYGLSQGGWVVPNAAARSADVAFVVVVSSPAVALGEEEHFSSLTGECPAPSGLSLDGVYARMVSAPASGFDPRPDLVRLRQPAFFIQGLADRSQPARPTLTRLEEIRAAEAKPWQIVAFPEADHILFEDRPPCQFGGHEVDWLAPLFTWGDQVLGSSCSA